MWGADPGTTQTVCGTSPGSWTMTANTPTDPGGAVQTYPDVQQLMNDYTGTAGANSWNQGPNGSDTPVANLNSLTSSYSIIDPPDSSGTWEAAYDIWLDNTPNHELMIWVDTSNARGTGGATVENSNVTIGGHSYTDMNYGGGLPILRLNTNTAAGSVDILAALKFWQSQGEVSATAGISQIDFGWEICNVSNLNYAVNGYSLTTR
jgi:hypothetical protein